MIIEVEKKEVLDRIVKGEKIIAITLDVIVKNFTCEYQPISIILELIKDENTIFIRKVVTKND